MSSNSSFEAYGAEPHKASKKEVLVLGNILG